MEKESENLLRARRKRVVSDLLKGREMATRLQTLLQRNPSTAAGDLIGSSSSVHSKLSLEILRSFSDAISQLNNCCVVPPPPPRQRGILSSNSEDQKFWWDDSARRRVQKNETLPRGKTGRGGYKRRKNSGEETWTNVCKTMEDGYAWRKYGQKQIHNSLHPRCYYRCTQKGREGCKATKQVQRISHDEFQTTYFGHHTCIIHSHINPFNNNDPQEQGGGDVDDSCSSCFHRDGDHPCHQDAAEPPEEEEESPLAAAYHPHQETSGVADDDIDYERCFENLDNLFRSEEMPLAFLDDI